MALLEGLEKKSMLNIEKEWMANAAQVRSRNILSFTKMASYSLVTLQGRAKRVSVKHAVKNVGALVSP